MGTRTVRLDDEAENALREIRRISGMTISQALKRGLLELRERVRQERQVEPWALYERLDLGPGGYASAPASDAKQAVRRILKKKHRK